MKKLILPKLKKMSFMSKLVAICGAFTLFNYIVYLIKLMVFPEQPLAYMITFAVILGVSLPIILRKQIEKITKKAFPYLKTVFAACLAFYMLSFVFMCGYIIVGMETETPPEKLPDETALVVFGAKVNGTGDSVRPGNSLRRRLDKAVEVLEGAPGAVCIVTGGQGPDEARAEGDVMRDYLVSKGIAEERIFVDDKAANTIENIENSKEILAEELSGYSVACVSSDFHIPRIEILSAKFDLDAEYFYYAPCANVATWYTSLVREYMSYGKLILFGKL